MQTPKVTLRTRPARLYHNQNWPWNGSVLVLATLGCFRPIRYIFPITAVPAEFATKQPSVGTPPPNTCWATLDSNVWELTGEDQYRAGRVVLILIQASMYMTTKMHDVSHLL